MYIINNRQSFKDYCLRRLGHPVIQINVDPEQVEDRIDDSLIKYRDYHYDGMERVYHKIVVTAQDITNQYLTLPEGMNGVIRVFPVGGNMNSSNMFNLQYQLHLNDFFNFSSATVAPYVMALTHIASIQEIFVGLKPIRFNRHTDKLYIDFNWTSDISAGNYIIVDGYMVVDPEVNTDVWNDPWLKEYATLLIKRQWSENLSKYSGMQLPGGVTFNAEKTYNDANEAIIKMEAELINSYSLPVGDLTG